MLDQSNTQQVSMPVLVVEGLAGAEVAFHLEYKGVGLRAVLLGVGFGEGGEGLREHLKDAHRGFVVGVD